MAPRKPEPLRARTVRWLARVLDVSNVLAQSGTVSPIYAGAGINRLTADWTTRPLSSDRELAPNLSVLRERARSLVRNTGFARNYIRAVQANVIGPNGVTLQVRPTGDMLGEESAIEELGDQIETAWYAWGQAATADGDLSWHDVELRMVALADQDGEAFLELLPGFDNPWGFAVRFWDADQLDETYNAVGNDGSEIRLGIELDQWGRRVAYHFWRRHPSEQVQNDRVRIPAERIVHLPARVLRAHQLRGVTAFAPVLMAARMLAGYREAELVAARTAAAKMGFITMDPEAGAFEPPAPGSVSTTMDAAPGTIDRLLPGESFAAWDPQHPSTAFEAFDTAILREIATGLGVSFATLTGNTSKDSYSSGRIGLLAERDEWMTRQAHVIDRLHRRVFAAWLRQAVMLGLVQLPAGFDLAESVTWRARRWQWVDPQNDLTAAQIALKEGLTSRQKICAESGEDFFDLMEQLGEEQAAANAAGVTLGEAPVTVAAAAAPPSAPTDAARLRMIRQHGRTR